MCVDIFSYLLGKKTGGGGGLEYETGSFQLTEDTARPTVSFATTHDKCPAYVIFFDAGDFYDTTNSGLSFEYVDFKQIFNKGLMSVESGSSRSDCSTNWYVRISNGSITSGYKSVRWGPDTSTSSSSTSYGRYFVTESNFIPYAGSTSTYWRANRPYKWLAIWL